jgi:hypothetical protein
MLVLGAKAAQNCFAHQNQAKNTPTSPSWCIAPLSAKMRAVDILAPHSANLLQLAGA